MLTAQEIINTVAAHLIKQGEHSRDYAGYYAYRSGTGLSSAVGCLLTDDDGDDDYTPEMEGAPVDMISHLLPARLRVHLELLTSLQNIHHDFPVESWPSELRKLAENLGLNAPKGC